MILLLLGIVVIAVIATLFWIPYYRWRNGKIKSITGPQNYPFIGMKYQFADTRQIFKKILQLHDTYGKTFRGYFFRELNIFTIEEDVIQFTLTSQKTLNKGGGYYFFRNWLGTGLLTSGGEKWRKGRKMITPAYHFKILDQFVDIFERNSNIMINKLQAEVGKGQTDIYPYINLCALDTICETAMGTQVNAQIKSDSEFVHATKEIGRIVMARSFEILKGFDFTYFFTEDYWKEQKALSVLHGFTMEVIKSRRDELIRTQPYKTSEDELNVKRKDNFLDLLLKSSIDGQPLSDVDIKDEVDTFMFAGHDTVSTGLSFALYLISNHPEVQERLVVEQKHIFGNDPKRQTTLADLKEMNYLEMVIKESLRLYPPAPIILREVSEDLHYKDWFLKKGSEIIIFIFGLHRNPKVFTDPDKFIPERFLPENQSGRNPFSYLPFSAGFRNCIGQKFAMLEMKCTISKMIRNYEFIPLVPKHEPILLLEVVLRSKNGVLLKLNNRSW